ncbi:MAG: hypothetical protein ACRD2F_03340 [Terriglobales bacterium]
MREAAAACAVNAGVFAYVANQPLTATDPLGLAPLGPPPINLTCLTCPDQDFWYGGGFDVNPGDPCAYVGDFDASCQEAPGLWPDGEPLLAHAIKGIADSSG